MTTPSNKPLNRLLEERTAELQQANQRLQQQVLEGQQAGERLVKINECFLSFQADPAVNINRLTALLGELLNAACALYNRLKDGMLCSTGQWNTPPGYNPTDNPEGHICYDVIRRGGDDIFVVRNLPHTPYAQTDPNVAPYGLQTYVGKAVKCNSSYVGSLCVVFQTDFEPTGDDEKLLGIIAAAISVEENRQRAEDELKQYRLHLEELVEARTAALSRTNEQLQNEIAGRNRIEAQLHNRAAELFTMLEVSKAISSTLDLEQVLALIAEQMVSVLNVSGCTLSRWDRAAGAVVTWVEKRRTNLQNVDQPGAAYPLDEFPATRAVLEQNRPAAIYLSDPAADPAEAAFMRRLNTASLLMLPLAAGDRVIGLVELDDEAARRFTGAETRLAQALAKQAAIAIENARLYKETDRLRAFNQNIVQSLEEGIIMEDADGLISFTNPRAAEMLEYQPGELTGRHWQTIVAPDHRAKSKAEAAKRPHGIASRYETVCLTKTGRQVPVIVSARPLFNQNSFSGVLAVFTDITESKAAEKALKESEERFRTVANFTHDWEYWTDPDGNYLYVSPSCERITGYRADEFLSNQVQVISIMHPADRSAWASHFTEHLASDDACAFDFRIITRSGDVRWIGHVCQAVYSAGGRHLGRRAGNRDITGRKKAEEALQQRNRQLELLNHAGQAFIFTLNLNQVLENVLEEVRRLLGVTACSAWLVDADTGELVCRQVTDPQSKVVLGWRLKSGQGLAGWVAEHGQSLNVPDVREDKRHYKGVDKKTGLPLRSILTVPLRVKGDVIGVIQVVDAEVRRFNPSDQTLMESLASTAARAIENAQLYQALKTSQEYAQNLIDSSLDTIIAVDPKRNIVAFNRAAQETFGYLPDEIIGRHVDILYADPEESRAVHNTTISTGRCVQEVLNRHKDGHTFPSLISASVLRDADGELVGVMGVSRDITERKRIDQEREQLLASEREQRLVAETLREVTLSLTSQTSHEAVLDEILRQVQRLVPYSTAHIMLLKGKTLYSAHWRGYDAFDSEAWIASLEQPLDEYLLDYETVQSQKPLVITDTRQEPRWRTHAETRWVRSHIMVPICHRDHVLGLLRLDSHIPGKFTDDDAERLQPLTNAAAIALENARLYEQALQDAQTKLTLLNEVNHRVKNNLATIIGLLYAEQHHTGLETRPAYQTIFNNMINRVQGLATVHNLLSAVEWSPLSLADLTKQVTHSALQALPSDKQISVVVEPSPVQVTPKQASNLAMVINELATNSAKHALPQTDGRLQITARIALKEDHVHFEFRDNGPGYPPPVLKGDPDFLNVGFELIHNLVRRNMRGALSLYNEHGAVTVITFNKEVDAGYEA